MMYSLHPSLNTLVIKILPFLLPASYHLMMNCWCPNLTFEIKLAGFNHVEIKGGCQAKSSARHYKLNKLKLDESGYAVVLRPP